MNDIIRISVPLPGPGIPDVRGDLMRYLLGYMPADVDQSDGYYTLELVRTPLPMTPAQQTGTRNNTFYVANSDGSFG